MSSEPRGLFTRREFYRMRSQERTLGKVPVTPVPRCRARESSDSGFKAWQSSQFRSRSETLTLASCSERGSDSRGFRAN